MQVPASNFYPNGFHRLVGYCRAEIDEVLASAILRSPRPKRVAQKIELLVWVRPSPIIILAIDDLRLLRMKLQPTFLQTRGYGSPNTLGFRLRPAMYDGVSRPGESHPEPLSEPYLNLSAHTAPAMEPRRTPICQCAHNFGSRLEIRATQCVALRK